MYPLALVPAVPTQPPPTTLFFMYSYRMTPLFGRAILGFTHRLLSPFCLVLLTPSSIARLSVSIYDSTVFF